MKYPCENSSPVVSSWFWLLWGRVTPSSNFVQINKSDTYLQMVGVQMVWLSTHLIVNRLRTDMVKEGNMMSSDDVVEILAIDLIGVVPDDEQIVISTNNGEPLVGSEAKAGQAYMNISKRVLGEEVPYLDLEETTSFFKKFAAIFKK